MADHGGTLIAMLVVLASVNRAAAKNYNINPPGSNSGGWNFLYSNSTSYDDLFKKTTLFVEDSLTFTFPSNTHNVYEVPPADIASCNISNPIHTYTQTVTVPLKNAGQHAFLCSLPNHCSQYGMHLLVTVDAPLGPAGFQSGALTPAPANAASFLQSESAMIVGALIVASAVLAL